jgi:hypothetical protein
MIHTCRHGTRRSRRDARRARSRAERLSRSIRSACDFAARISSQRKIDFARFRLFALVNPSEVISAQDFTFG